MKRMIASALVIIAAMATCACAQIDARGVMVMNLKSESVLYVQDEHKRVAPASLTKIMTMFLLLDDIKSGRARLTDTVRVSKRAAETKGSSMGLKAGERVPLSEIMKGVAVASGNDASVAAAEHVSGSVSKFVARMNAKARELGLKNTRFTNPHGLPPADGQYTTARDMLVLTKKYLEAHPYALEYHSTPLITHGSKTTTNKNELLGTCAGVDGVKTGWIQASGHNLVSTARRGDVRILCVVLGASTSKAEADESRFLIEAAFNTVKSGGAYKISSQLADRKSLLEAEEENKKTVEKSAVPRKKS